MTQRNRAKVEVETLEDRITPAALNGYVSSKLSELKSTLQAKVGSLPSQINSQLSDLKAKINSLNGYSNGTSNGNSHAHSKICTALNAAYAKLVAMGAPQSVLNKVAALQAKFGCGGQSAGAQPVGFYPMAPA